MTTPISFAVKPPPAASYRPSPLGNGSRAGPPSRKLFEQGDEEEDDDRRGSSSSRRPRDERVDGFSNGRARGESRKEEPLVIPSMPNRDWRDASRRTPSYRPDARQIDKEDAITHERTGDGPVRSGLRKIVKEEVKVEPDHVEVKREEVVDNGSAVTATTTTVKAEPMTDAERAHQEALNAILAGRSVKETDEERSQRELRIEMQENKLNLSEEDAFKRDMKTLPAEVSFFEHRTPAEESDAQSTLDDYEQIPVSAFGLAMARGMGWNPKADDNTKLHEPKVRPQLLGLGATPMDPTIRPTHNKNSSKKDRQADRNAKTGRGFVATSLLVKKEREGSGTPAASRSGSPGSEKRRREGEDERDVKRERSDRYDDRNGREGRDYDRRRGDYETEDERARRKAKESGRYETEEERARRKAREYETDEERARRKARERERERDREYETEEQRARRKARERERDAERDSERRR